MTEAPPPKHNQATKKHAYAQKYNSIPYIITTNSPAFMGLFVVMLLAKMVTVYHVCFYVIGIG